MNVNIDLQKDEPIAIIGKNSPEPSIEFNGDINVLESKNNLESKDEQLDPDEGFDDYQSNNAKSELANLVDDDG